jgi:hypothetical protein
MMRRLWHDLLLPWLASLLVALALLAVAWLLWSALRQEQRPAGAMEEIRCEPRNL